MMLEDAEQRRAITAAALRGAVTRLARRLRAERPPGALSSTKVAVLAHLYRQGPSTPGQLAHAERQHPQSLTRVLAELEQGGLISRTSSMADRRASILAITTTGVQLLELDMSCRDAWLAEAIAGRSEAEIGLLRIAATLIDDLADAELAPSARRAAS
jgi:DNA-binding MarR family transcriptional regulator